MTRLFAYELAKLLKNRRLRRLLGVLLVLDLLLLCWQNLLRPSALPAGAYRRIGDELAPLSMQQKGLFLDEKYTELTALQNIYLLFRDEALGTSAAVLRARRGQLAETLGRYLEVYESGEYLVYTPSLSKELRFISEIRDEYQTAASYPDFLEEIARQANALSGISIFQNSGYSAESLQKTAKAFAPLTGVSIDYLPQKGVLAATDFSLSSVVLLLCVFCLSGASLSEEKENGLLSLICSTRAGRGKTALAKLAAFFVCQTALTVLFCLLHFFFCAALYGFGDLGRSVQSLPALLACPLPVSVFGYLLLFVAFQCAAAFVLGLCALTASLFFRGFYSGYLTVLATLGVSFALYGGVSATGRWGLFKYANLAGILDTGPLLGNYLHVSLFNRPVTRLASVSVFAVMLSLALIFLFWFRFQKGGFAPPARRKSLRQRLSFPARPGRSFGGLYRHESYKLLVQNGFAVLLLLFAALQLPACFSAPSALLPEEQYYRGYMLQWQGPYTHDTYTQMLEANEAFAPLRQLRAQYFSHRITQEDYTSILQNYYFLQQKQAAFQRVQAQAVSVMQRPGAQLVYETGYRSLFDFYDKKDLSDALALGLFCTAAFGAALCLDKRTGMDLLIGATALGREKTVRCKFRVLAAASLAPALLSCLPRLVQTGEAYGLPGLLCPACSLPFFRGIPAVVPLWCMVLFWFFLRWAAVFGMGCIGMYLSYRTGRTVLGLCASAACWILPVLLSQAGLSWAKWFSVYPLLHLPIFTGGSFVYACLLAVFFAGGAYLSYSALCTRYGR